MFASGVMFEIGAILLAAAEHYVMLILGRVFLGIAVRCIPSPLLHVAKGACKFEFGRNASLSLGTMSSNFNVCGGAERCVWDADFICQCVGADVQL